MGNSGIYRHEVEQIEQILLEHHEMRALLVKLCGCDDPVQLGEMLRCLPLMTISRPELQMQLDAARLLMHIPGRN